MAKAEQWTRLRTQIEIELYEALETLLDEIDIGLPSEDLGGSPTYENIHRASDASRAVLARQDEGA